MQKRFEYLVRSRYVTGRTSPDIQDAMDAHGQQGWELVSAIQGEDHRGLNVMMFFFKRCLLDADNNSMRIADDT